MNAREIGGGAPHKTINMEIEGTTLLTNSITIYMYSILFYTLHMCKRRFVEIHTGKNNITNKQINNKNLLYFSLVSENALTRRSRNIL